MLTKRKNNLPRSSETVVMKFGGASVATPERIRDVALRIQQRSLEVRGIVIVVSAMGDTTDKLIALAKAVHPEPPRREYDMLVTVGERVSIALLAMALERLGCEAVSFTGSQSGIITSCKHSDAQIVDVRPHRIVAALQSRQVVIVAGFQGCSTRGEITTLGRGGSDTTAVALAAVLGASQVEFYKDVPGIFSADPHQDPTAERLEELTYGKALTFLSAGHPVLHPRCVQLAQLNAIPLCVRSFHSSGEGSPGCSWIRDAAPAPERSIFEQSSLHFSI